MRQLALVLAVLISVATSGAGTGSGSETESARPELASLEPASVPARTAFSLVLNGAGFDGSTVILVEAGQAGRYLRRTPAERSAERLVVEFPLGLPPVPRERAILVEAASGERSLALTLTIGEVRDGAEETVPAEEEISGGNWDEETQPDTAAAGGPAIREIRPAAIPAGRALLLEVFGEGFSESSKVWILANLHAGTSRLPDYGLREFPVYFIDQELVEVELDRGFAPNPGVRDVIVEDAEGRRSAPAVLRILAQEEEG